MVDFVEKRDAGKNRREFANVDPPPGKPRPGAYDLGWSRKVVQVGTRASGGIRCVEVHYHDGSRRVFKGAGIHYVLTAVGGLRSDAPRGSATNLSVGLRARSELTGSQAWGLPQRPQGAPRSGDRGPRRWVWEGGRP